MPHYTLIAQSGDGGAETTAQAASKKDARDALRQTAGTAAHGAGRSRKSSYTSRSSIVTPLLAYPAQNPQDKSVRGMGQYAHIPICATKPVASFMHAVTDGAFDPGIRTIYAENGCQPTERARRDARHGRASTAPERIILRLGGTLTFNGIAQGFVTDKIVALMKANELQTGIISVGEIAAVGSPDRRSVWPVRLAGEVGGTGQRNLHIHDKAIATSSPGNLFGDDARADQIIEPHSGRPVQSHWSQVSVIHTSAAVADALSTAAILLEPEQLSAVMPLVSSMSVIAVTAQGEKVLL